MSIFVSPTRLVEFLKETISYRLFANCFRMNSPGTWMTGLSFAWARKRLICMLLPLVAHVFMLKHMLIIAFLPDSILTWGLEIRSFLNRNGSLGSNSSVSPVFQRPGS